jgi:type I restriction enzyme S subunit
MANYKKYSEYKETGIEWLSQIPKHWEVKKLKYETIIQMGQSPSSSDCNQDGIGTEFLQGNAEFGSKYPSAKNYCINAKKVSSVNDLLFSVRAPVGAINISNKEYAIGRGLCAISCKTKLLLSYITHAISIPKNKLLSIMTGSTFEAVSLEQVKNSELPLPPLYEQEEIAKFLDDKVSKIDELSEKVRKQIELLGEKRTSLINEAVTKGLNKDVELKETGIEWLPQIPKHWNKTKIKYTTYVKGRIGWHGLKSSDFKEKGSFLVTGTDFKNGIVDWNSCYHVDKEKYDIDPFIQLKENDLLITKDGTIGKIAIVKNMPYEATLNSGIFVTRCLKESIYKTRFMYWILNSKIFSSFIDINSDGTTIIHLYQNVFINFSYPLPPLSEQKEIAEFLDIETAKIDKLKEKLTKELDLLKEYKTSLITSAVTGQIDVREHKDN